MNMAVKSIVKHPNLYGNLYKYKTLRDLALLKLSNDLEFNDAIQPISLPSPNYSNYNLFSSELIFAGYGFEEMYTEKTKKEIFYVEMLNHNRDASQYFNFFQKRTKKVNNMKKIKVNLTMSECNRYAEYESLLFSHTLGLWYGDSGGPLMKMSPNSTNHVVIGIARGARFCSSGIANMYTRIGQYVPWIQKNLEKIDDTTYDFEFDMGMIFNSVMDFFDYNGIEKFDEENTAHDLDLKIFGWMILIDALTALALLVFYKFNSNDIIIHDNDEVIEREMQRKTDTLLNLADKIEKIDGNTAHDLDLENYLWMFLIVGLTALAWSFAINFKSEVNLVKINVV